MALEVGSITIGEGGEATGSGLSLRIFNKILGHLSEEARESIAETMVPFCEGMAEAIIEEFTENAVITVTIQTSDSGLQRTPNPNTADTDTQGPSEEKQLSGTLA